MDLRMRPIAADELEEFVRAQELTFGMHVRAGDVENERLIFEPERSLGVFDEDRLVGGAIACTFEMSVPGGITVPTAGITSVGVQPTHRRAGILTNLMRQQLDDIHERGEPLAALWASEAPIYGRFGYGNAAYAAKLGIDRLYTGFARPFQDPGRTQLVDRETFLARAPAVYERVRRDRPGMMGRNEAWWTYTLADEEHFREGASAYFFAVHQSNGRDDAYAAYRVRQAWEVGEPASTLEVEEAIGETPEANAAIWRFLFDVDLIKRIEAFPRPADDPLLFLLADPRRLRLTLLDGLYVRVVDVTAALASRRYAESGSLVVDVADPFCEWNQGRFALEAGPDGVSCDRTTVEADVEVDATALGALYLGGVRFAALAAAGRIREVRPGALQIADGMFASAVAPWCPSIF